MALHHTEGRFSGGEAAASHPFIVDPQLGDNEGAGEGPILGHVAARCGRALPACWNTGGNISETR